MSSTDSPGLDPRVPVTVITGFLGAGKTTLVNRILTEQHGRRIAVIENEFGEIGIDDALVIDADEEIFEMNNGCICCTVRGDLIRILGSLMKRRDRFDHILVETTGLADPAPVVQTFFADDEIRSQMRIDAIVTVVDAKHLPIQLDDTRPGGIAREAVEQIAFADRLLINKVDLVTADAVDDVERRVRDINTSAEMLRTTMSAVELDWVLDVRGFDLANIAERGRELVEGAAHGGRHDVDVHSVGIEMDGRVDVERLNRWLGWLLEERGADIFRMKGILDVEGSDERYVFQGVHMLFDGRADRPWRAGEDRRNRMVFIGRGLDRDELVARFRACLA
jgi:G3E family GTPase